MITSSSPPGDLICLPDACGNASLPAQTHGAGLPPFPMPCGPGGQEHPQKRPLWGQESGRELPPLERYVPLPHILTSARSGCIPGGRPRALPGLVCRACTSRRACRAEGQAAEGPPGEGLSLMATPEKYTGQHMFKENGHRVRLGWGGVGGLFLRRQFWLSKAPFIPLRGLGHCPCSWEQPRALYLQASAHFSWRTPRAVGSSPSWGLWEAKGALRMLGA